MELLEILNAMKGDNIMDKKSREYTLYKSTDYKLVCNKNGLFRIYKEGESKPIYIGSENIQRAIDKLMDLTGINYFELEAIAMIPKGSWQCMEVK